jgi:multiple sugar transport system permease protein
MAFLDYNVIGESSFVGVDNFAAVLFDSVFWISILAHGRVCFLEPLVGISTADYISALFERVTPRECLVPRIVLFACLSLWPDCDANVEDVF